MSSTIVDIVDVSAFTGSSTFLITEGWVSFYNHSIFGLGITLSDGNTFYAPPQARRVISIEQPIGSFKWVQVLVSNIGSGTPISTLMVVETLDAYDTHIEADIAGLGGVQNIGSVSTLPTANTLVNDGNVSGTEVIEMSIGGQKTRSDLNDGSARFMPETNGVFGLAALQVVAGDATHFAAVHMDNGAIQTNGLGNLGLVEVQAFVDTTSVDRTPLEMIDVKAGGKVWDLRMKQDGSAYLFNATDSAFAWTATPTSGIQFGGLGGKLQCISRFTGVGDVTVAHGLGTTPNLIIAMQNVAGSQTMGVNTVGSVNCTIKTGAGLAWWAIAALIN